MNSKHSSLADVPLASKKDIQLIDVLRFSWRFLRWGPRRIVRFLNHFFFQKIGASSMGFLRMAWGFTVFFSMLSQWTFVHMYYTNGNLMPHDVSDLLVRSNFHYTIFQVITEPHAVFTVYLLFLCAALCAALGIFPRLSTLITVVLYFSFHERDSLVLAGGETVLRTLGFLIAIAPNISAFSLERADQQLKHWVKHQTLLAPPTMSIWPYRLLLWQFIVIYVTSGWDKLLGNLWWKTGTAVAVALHHPSFSRMWFPGIRDAMATFSLPLSRLVVVYELTWLLLLIPNSVWKKLGFSTDAVKRAVIFWGVVFHGSILIFMEVGTFPVAMFLGYIGMLHDEDFTVLRRLCNRRWKTRLIVLYDGSCGFCRRSMAWIAMLDWLKRTEPMDFRDGEVRKEFAHNVPFKSLDRALHVNFVQKGKSEHNEMKNGFDALRSLAWHLPPLWPIAPFLYIPGVGPIGRAVYQYIADRRNRCTDEGCLVV